MNQIELLRRKAKEHRAWAASIGRAHLSRTELQAVARVIRSAEMLEEVARENERLDQEARDRTDDLPPVIHVQESCRLCRQPVYRTRVGAALLPLDKDWHPWVEVAGSSGVGFDEKDHPIFGRPPLPSESYTHTVRRLHTATCSKRPTPARLKPLASVC